MMQTLWIPRQVKHPVANTSLLLAILLTTALVGCSSLTAPKPGDIDHAKERAMAEIAIASVTGDSHPQPDTQPKVGAKCPDCGNNVGPPEGCKVGYVGDGRTCTLCQRCGGDGRIDDQDLKMGPPDLRKPIAINVEPVPDPIPDPVPNAEPIEVPKEITLHMTAATRSGWPSKWFSESREDFEKSGWIVRAVLEPEVITKVSYFDVVAPDGEVFQFFEPITLDHVSHLETR